VLRRHRRGRGGRRRGRLVGQNWWRKMSPRLLVSSSTRLEASDSKATKGAVPGQGRLLREAVGLGAVAVHRHTRGRPGHTVVNEYVHRDVGVPGDQVVAL